MYVRYDDPFRPPSGKRQGMNVLIIVTVVLFIGVIALGAFVLFSGTDGQQPGRNNTQTTDGDQIEPSISIATPTPVPEVVRKAYENTILYPATELMNVPIGEPNEAVHPNTRAVQQAIYVNGEQVSTFTRDPGVAFMSPLTYQQVPGILTFRGNNFRNVAAWGTTEVNEGILEQVWEYTGLGSRKAAPQTGDWYWSGVGWTGQPLAVQWDDDVRQMMNLYPEKKAKDDLVEIIIAAQDGKVHFLDLDDGRPTRDPLDVGGTVKGTPAIDPRGYPLLYGGHGDRNTSDNKCKFFIYSLIDGELLYDKMSDGDPRAHRTWGANDSSPLVCASSDTAIFANENGMVYTLRLNTKFNRQVGTISISPENVDISFVFNNSRTNEKGIESSAAIYRHYAYFGDNGGNLTCLDLNSMTVVWSRQLEDDTDSTPVLEEDNGRVYLYVATEVDLQGSTGAAYTYKLDAMTGSVIWQTSQPCYADKNQPGNHLAGGVLGTPIVGKHNISDLVIFPYAMTNGPSSGNKLVAYNKNTGEQAWSYQMNIYSWSSPVDIYDEEGNAYIAIGDMYGQIHFVNGQTGERLHYIQTKHQKGTSQESEARYIEGSAIVYHDTLIIGTRSGAIFGVKIR